MKIVHSNHFLKEGFSALGAELFPLDLSLEKALIESIHEVCPNPDIVILEFCGNTFIDPEQLLKCPYPLIAYVYDITLNLYLCRHLLHFFDYVFVDQRKALAELEDYGVKAHWLPLCVNNTDFRKAIQNPIYKISFVGLVNEFRIKRKNILAHLRKHYQVDEFSNISCSQMQDIFSKSQMTLNENLFDGLTLRVLQAMAAGTLLLTEADMDSVDCFFKDGEHFVSYTHDNIIDVVKDVLDRPDYYAKIALRGQEECRKYHTSTVRAKELFSVVCNSSDPIQLFSLLTDDEKKIRLHKNTRIFDEKLQIHAILYKFNHVRVYGGYIGSCVANLKGLAQTNGIYAAYATCLLGDIHFFLNNKDKTRYFYDTSSIMLKNILQNKKNREHNKIALLIYCHHALFYLLENNISQLGESIRNVLDVLIKNLGVRIKNNSHLAPDVYISLIIIYSYEYLNKEVDIGFKLNGRSSIPDNAFDVALATFKKDYDENLLPYILKYLKKHKIAGELLPVLYEYAEKHNTPPHISLEILKIAKSYYNYTWTI